MAVFQKFLEKGAIILFDFEKNREAYKAMKEELSAKYPGQWAAFFEGKFVAVSSEKGELIAIVRKKLGKVRAYVQKIEREEPTIRLPM